jgi:hypothetical protein
VVAIFPGMTEVREFEQQIIISNCQQEQAIIQAATDEAIIRLRSERLLAQSGYIPRFISTVHSLSNSRCHGSLCNTVLVFLWLAILVGSSLAVMARCFPRLSAVPALLVILSVLHWSHLVLRICQLAALQGSPCATARFADWFCVSSGSRAALLWFSLWRWIYFMYGSLATTIFFARIFGSP